MKKNQQLEDSVMLYVFFFVTITFVAISGVQTYLGYQDFLGFGALPFAFAISLLLLFLNLALRLHRVKGKRIIGISTILLIVIVFSFMGNFNAIYHKFSGKEAEASSLTNANIIFSRNMDKAKSALNGSKQHSEYIDFKRKIDMTKTNIRRQITDGENRGYGDKAKKHVIEAEQLLDIKLTSRHTPKGTDKGLSYWKEFADEIINDIEKNESLVMKKKFGQWSILGEIDELSKKPENEITLIGLRKKSEEIKSKVEILTSKEVDFEEIQDDGGSTKNIADTLKTAFSREHIGIESWLVALVSLLLDLFVPLVTLVYYKHDDDDDYSTIAHNQSSSSRSRMSYLKDY